MSKKTKTKTTSIIETEEIRENPVSKQIKKFFDTGDFDPELTEYQFEIRVMQWSDKRGKYVTLQGTKYNDLEGMMEALGRKFGSGRYKFYIKAKDAEGKLAGAAVIEDYDFLWDSDEEPEEPNIDDREEEREDDRQSNVVMILLKQMEMQNNLLIAALNAKSNNSSTGFKTNEILDVLKTGIALGSGKDMEDDGDFLTNVIKSPLGQALAVKLLEKKADPPVNVPT